MVSGSADQTVRVWDLQTSLSTLVLEGHGHPVMGVHLTTDMQWVVSSDGKTILVWDFETGELTRTLQGHEKQINTLHMAGTNIVSGAADCTLRVWDW